MPDRLPQAVLLDMDDTILADSDSTDRCWQTVCQGFSSRLLGHAPDALLAAIQEYREWFWSDAERHRRGRLNLGAARQEIVTEALLRLGIEPFALAAAMAQTYSALREATLRPFPGALESLEWFRHRKVRLALLTNGGAVPQRHEIRKWGLAPFFDCIVIEEEFGVGKPDARVYRHALDQLGVTPQDAWMVGDNLEWDVAAPQELGIYGIWVDLMGVGVPTSSAVQPNRLIQTLSDLRSDHGEPEPPRSESVRDTTRREEKVCT